MPKQPRGVFVVGSGPSGIHAALALIERGIHVTLLDGGLTGDHTLAEQLRMPFAHLKQHPAQEHVFLGPQASGILDEEGGTMHSKLRTQGRWSYVTAHTARALPLQTHRVSLLQTLAQGGLSEVWGGACDFFSVEELNINGLDSQRMRTMYQAIVTRIGVSGTSNVYRLLPPARQSILTRSLLASTHTHPTFTLTPSILALLTQPLGARKPATYNDLDYWLEEDKALYRAKYTLADLLGNPLFTYIPGQVVRSVTQRTKGLQIIAQSLDGTTTHIYAATSVLLGAGAANSTRIALDSLELYATPIPFITKTHVLTPCIVPRTLFHKLDHQKHGLCQLLIRDSVRTGPSDATYTQLYAYSSLLYYKLVPYIPLPAPQALRMASLLGPSLVIADTRFPSLTPTATLSLTKNGPLSLSLLSPTHTLSPEHRKRYRALRSYLRSQGMYPLSTIIPPEGSTAHYAGGIAYSRTPGILSSDEHGEIHQMPGVFVVDSARWALLPGKPPALTLMAQARLTGDFLADRILQHHRVYKKRK